MNYRRLIQAAEWSVVAAVVALHACIYFGPGVAWLQVLKDAQPLVAATLLVAWGVLEEPGRLWLRAIAVPALVIGWGVAVTSGERPYFNPAGSEVPWPFAFALTATLVLGVIRLCGASITGIPANRSEARPQFSIRNLLLITTLVAVTIGALESLRPIISGENASDLDQLNLRIIQLEADATFGRVELARGLIPTPASLRQFVLSLAVAGSACGALATVLRPGAIWARLALLAVAIPVAAAYLTHLTFVPVPYYNAFTGQIVELTTAFSTVAALVGVSALPLRLNCYRLQRSPTCHVGRSLQKPLLGPTQSAAASTSLPHLAHTECGLTLP